MGKIPNLCSIDGFGVEGDLSDGSPGQNECSVQHFPDRALSRAWRADDDDSHSLSKLLVELEDFLELEFTSREILEKQYFGSQLPLHNLKLKL